MHQDLLASSCLNRNQSGKPIGQWDALSGHEAHSAALLDTMAMEAAEAVSGVKPPDIFRSIQCRAASPMSCGKHNIDTIVLHTPEGHVLGTLSVLSGTRAGFDWYLPPSGELYKCNDYTRFASWHAGDWSYNKRSIGIEQWDFAQNMPNAPDAHYQRLARLCAYLVETLDLAIRHAKTYGEYGFIAHATITPRDRWDPGRFDYDKLLSLVSDLVKGRPEPKPPEPEKPTPEPSAWLPDAPRSSFGGTDAYTKEDLESGKVHVLTLDGKERATIVPKGPAFLVPKVDEPVGPKPPEKKPEEPEKPLPEPEIPVGPKPSGAAKIIDGYFRSLRPAWSHVPYVNIGEIIVEEAKRAGIALQAACALVEQESAGRNVFGADWGVIGRGDVPFAHMAVTKTRVKELVAHTRRGGTSNGVGTTQLTWPDFIYEAENRGGAHMPKNQMRVGFALMYDYFRRFGEAAGYGAYNRGERSRLDPVGRNYANACILKSRAWRSRLGSFAANVEEPPPLPVEEEDEMEEPKPPPAPKPKLSKAAKAIIAAAVPVVASLMLWASTGTLDETEFSVGATGLLTALLVYFVPNTTD